MEFRPDIIHIGKGESVVGSVIKAIKERLDVCVLHFNGDFRWQLQPWMVDIGRYADYTMVNHKEKKILDAYLPIWKALAKDSTDGVKDNATRLSKAASEAEGKAAEDSLKTQLGALAKAATEMKANDLESARESMKGLSRAIVGIFESHEVKMPAKYKIIECTMVNEKWIQDSEDVLNPFYGSAMLRCGSKVGEIG